MDERRERGSATNDARQPRGARPGSIALVDLTSGTDERCIVRAATLGLPLPDEPWSLSGELVIESVVDLESYAGVLDAAQRGADVLVDVAPELRADFVEDAGRLGLAVDEQAGAPAATPWAPLLDALAAGRTIEDAARRCHLSLRTAHRRLAEARTAMGVSSTAAAVARWVSTAADRTTAT